MQAKDFIGLLKQAMMDAKEKGTETVSMDAFLAYLDGFKPDLERVEEYKLAEFEAENERNLVDRKVVLESVFAYGQMAIRSAMVINGGAAIAILAFIGNLWSRSFPQDALAPLANAMAAFPFGALAAAAAAGVTYACQYCYSRPWMKTAYVFHALSILMVVASLGLFGIGVWNSYEAFSVQLSGTPKTSAAPQSPPDGKAALKVSPKSPPEKPTEASKP